MKHIESMKTIAAKRAAEMIHDGMLVGLGSGSTVAIFIELLGKRCQEGLAIQAVASSQMTHDLALQHKIPLVSIDDIETLDITVDGADEIDTKKRMIKGGGAALLREKILAANSNELIIIVDETKMVPFLGRHPLAIEVVPFGWKATENLLRKRGYEGKWRKNADGSFLITENGHYLFDIISDKLLMDPEIDERELQSIAGIVETGIFIGYTGRVFVGKKDGSVEVLD